ncbi:MAG: hypothetical protein BGO29_11610 [Bacteroidales bacterium 36-12]|nr:MAG: hypothetical protein BGO29_11610 [Bacteroidales bacterium 36-12]
MKKIFTFLLIVALSTGVVLSDALPAGNYYAPNDPGDGSTFYISLTDAFTAINDNGIAGNITLYINGDITQTTNVGLINPSEYTITIRPDSDVDRTITFDQANDNAGPSGALCIGIKSSRAWADLGTAQNIIIDGFAEGGSTRRLKIMTSDTQNTGNGPIVILNDSKDITVRNTIIEHKGATGGTSGYGIYIRCQTDRGVNTMPQNVTIENNHITCKKNSAFQGIGTYANAAPAITASGVVIKDNYIDARTRGIFLNHVNSIEISGNEFHVVQTNASTLSSGIMGNGGLSGDIMVQGNNFAELKTYNSTTGDYGMKGIIASGGGTWYIDNNFFGGVDKSFGDGFCMLQTVRVGSTCVIRHNTFYMKSLTKKPVSNVEAPSAADPSYCAINIAAGTPEISNNIFISAETEVPNFFIRGTNGGTSNHNIFYFDAANEKAFINGTYATLANYQTGSGKDADSKFVNVEFFNAATGDLRIAGASEADGNLAVPRLAGVLKDILGTERDETTYAGAHESVLPFLYTYVDQYQQEEIKIKQNYSGIEIELNGLSDIELYNMNGVLLDKVRTDGVYSHELGKGMFIIRINGQSTKFVR